MLLRLCVKVFLWLLILRFEMFCVIVINFSMNLKALKNYCTLPQYLDASQ